MWLWNVSIGKAKKKVQIVKNKRKLMYMNRTVQKTFPVTASALPNSRQHLHENMFIKKKKKKNRGEKMSVIVLLEFQHCSMGKFFVFFLKCIVRHKDHMFLKVR